MARTLDCFASAVPYRSGNINSDIGLNTGLCQDAARDNTTDLSSIRMVASELLKGYE